MNIRFFDIKYVILLHLIIGALFITYTIPVLEEIGLKSDSPHYIQIGENLAKHGEFILDGQTSAYRPPVYPVFIAIIFSIFGEHFSFILFMQLLLSCVNVFLFFKIAKRFLAERHAKLAVLLFAVMPPIILFNAMVMSETLFLNILLLYLAVTKPKAGLLLVFISGILLGILTLTKPYWLIAGAIPVWQIWRENLIGTKKLIRIVVLVAGTGLLLLPWILRNNAQLGTYQITTNSGVNFWIGNNEYSHGGYLYENHPDNKLSGIKDEVARNDAGWRMGFDFLRNNPEKLPTLAVKKLKRALTPMYDQLYYFYKQKHYLFPIQHVSYIPKLPALVLFAPFMIFFLPGSYAFFAYRKKFKIFAYLFMAILAVMLMFFGDGRFLYPLFPFMIISTIYLFEIRHKPQFTSRNLIPLLVVVMITSAWLHDIIKAIVFY